MRRTLISLLSKRLTVPRLSPTHTKAEVVRFLVASGTYVSAYDPVVILRCSPDLIADPADRLKGADHEPLMILETLEEGIIRYSKEFSCEEGGERKKEGVERMMLDVGTELGVIDNDDDDDVEDDWFWEAYIHEEEE